MFSPDQNSDVEGCGERRVLGAGGTGGRGGGHKSWHTQLAILPEDMPQLVATAPRLRTSQLRLVKNVACFEHDSLQVERIRVPVQN